MICIHHWTLFCVFDILPRTIDISLQRKRIKTPWLFFRFRVKRRICYLALQFLYAIFFFFIKNVIDFSGSHIDPKVSFGPIYRSEILHVDGILRMLYYENLYGFSRRRKTTEQLSKNGKIFYKSDFYLTDFSLLVLISKLIGLTTWKFYKTSKISLNRFEKNFNKIWPFLCYQKTIRKFLSNKILKLLVKSFLKLILSYLFSLPNVVLKKITII